MTRKLRHADMIYRPPSKERGIPRAANIIAEAMEDCYRGGDPQFRGNIADALYHIATALNRIAEAIDRIPGPEEN
jgi:hypothetical protein